MFYQYSQSGLKKKLLEGNLFRTDARATGFTLFKTSALKEIGYPYGENRTNSNCDKAIDGWDMDVSRKFNNKFGGVWNYHNPEMEVRHITYHHVGEDDFLKQ